VAEQGAAREAEEEEEEEQEEAERDWEEGGEREGMKSCSEDKEERGVAVTTRAGGRRWG